VSPMSATSTETSDKMTRANPPLHMPHRTHSQFYWQRTILKLNFWGYLRFSETPPWSIAHLAARTCMKSFPLVTNRSPSKTTTNASSILTAIGKHEDIPLYPGAYNPISRPPVHSPTEIHGESGLDGTDLLPKGRAPVRRHVSAVEAMATALRSTPRGTAYLVATGALTNVATLFRQYPELADHVKGLSIMGGAIGGGFSPAVMGVVNGAERIGNWTQFAEFNIIIDPEAAAGIFENEVLRGKMTMVPLDLSHQVLATRQVRELLLYGPEGRSGKGPGPAAAEVDERAAEGEGKSTLRRMLVELLMFFAKTYEYVTYTHTHIPTRKPTRAHWLFSTFHPPPPPPVALLTTYQRRIWHLRRPAATRPPRRSSHPHGQRSRDRVLRPRPPRQRRPLLGAGTIRSHGRDGGHARGRPQGHDGAGPYHREAPAAGDAGGADSEGRGHPRFLDRH